MVKLQIVLFAWASRSEVRERAEEQRRRYEQSTKPDPDAEPESR